MKFMDYIYKALGFETEEKMVSNKTSLGEYNIKKVNEMPEKIDGVPVYYPENLREAKGLSDLLKKDDAFFVNLMFSDVDDKEKIIEYFEGATSVLGVDMKILQDRKLIAILPEGVNIEEVK